MAPSPPVRGQARIEPRVEVGAPLASPARDFGTQRLVSMDILRLCLMTVRPRGGHSQVGSARAQRMQESWWLSKNEAATKSRCVSPYLWKCAPLKQYSESLVKSNLKHATSLVPGSQQE